MATTTTHRASLTALSAVVLILAATAVAGCGSKSSSASNGKQTTAVVAPPAPTAASSSYNSTIDPAQFTTKVTNPYFPLKPGSVRILKGVKDGVPQVHTTTITHETKKVMGVETVVIKDNVTTNGKLTEKTSDWYAQDSKGNVWYFGEATAEYLNGVVTGTKGSWEAGVDGAKPGFVMLAHPKPGPVYNQEFRPGVAEDKGQVLRVTTLKLPPLGTFKNVIVVNDTNPLDPAMVGQKWYAPGVGLLQSVRTGSSHVEHSRLVKVTPGR